ncbi:MAG: TatD family hydrolase [Chitinophagales bacterium]
MLIDTHSHLYLEHFKEDIDDVINRCKVNGVEKVILPNIDSKSLVSLEKLCSSYPDVCLPAIGLHPCSVQENWQEELVILKKHIDEQLYLGNRIYGIGEIGLDYYWDTSFKEQQHAALRTQIKWAKALGLPIILHCRDSFDDLFDIVKELNDDNLSGIFHCFSGTLEEANKIIELGNFYVGIGGVVTFKKSQDLRDVVQEIPLEYIVIETDSPYLTPSPYRGKRNESSYVLHVAETLATVKQVGLDEIGKVTSENARKVFQLAVNN